LLAAIDALDDSKRRRASIIRGCCCLPWLCYISLNAKHVVSNDDLLLEESTALLFTYPLGLPPLAREMQLVTCVTLPSAIRRTHSRTPAAVWLAHFSPSG
jgi:hypothetical protein